MFTSPSQAKLFGAASSPPTSLLSHSRAYRWRNVPSCRYGFSGWRCLKYEATKRSASDRCGSSNRSLLPPPSPIPPIPRSSSKTTVDGDDSASDSEFRTPPTPDASAMLLLAARAGGSLPVDTGALAVVAPPPPAAGVPVVVAELPAVASALFGDVTLVMKSKAEDSPKYSPGRAEWLLLGRSEWWWLFSG